MSLDITMSQPRKITGFHVLAMLLGFFITVTGVNVYMMYHAVSTFGGLETEDAYRKGLAYNKTIAQGEAQNQLGWAATIEAGSDKRLISLDVVDRSKAPVPGLTFKGAIGRAATNRFDAPLAFHETTPGHYEAVLDAPLEVGAWVAHLSAVKVNSASNDTEYEVRQRLWIAP